MKYAINQRLLVSLASNAHCSGLKEANQMVFEPTEIRILEYSPDGLWVKFEYAETLEPIWRKVSDFPDVLTQLADRDEETLSPVDQYLLAKQQRAFGEYLCASNRMRVTGRALIEVGNVGLTSDSVSQDGTRVTLLPDSVKRVEEVITAWLTPHTRHFQIVGIFPDISP